MKDKVISLLRSTQKALNFMRSHTRRYSKPSDSAVCAGDGRQRLTETLGGSPRRVAEGFQWLPCGYDAQLELAQHLEVLAESGSTVTLTDVVDTLITAALCDDHEDSYGRPASRTEREAYRLLAVNLACAGLQAMDDELRHFVARSADAPDPVLCGAQNLNRAVAKAIKKDLHATARRSIERFQRGPIAGAPTL